MCSVRAEDVSLNMRVSLEETCAGGEQSFVIIICATRKHEVIFISSGRLVVFTVTEIELYFIIPENWSTFVFIVG